MEETEHGSTRFLTQGEDEIRSGVVIREIETRIDPPVSPSSGSGLSDAFHPFRQLNAAIVHVSDLLATYQCRL